MSLSLVYEKALELQLELIDLQSDSILKEKFNSLKLDRCYASFNEVSKHSADGTKVLLFGSTYLFEQRFSVVNISKAHYRSQLTDEQLRAVLTIASTKLTSNFDTLAKNGDQQHCSQ